MRVEEAGKLISQAKHKNIHGAISISYSLFDLRRAARHDARRSPPWPLRDVIFYAEIVRLESRVVGALHTPQRGFGQTEKYYILPGMLFSSTYAAAVYILCVTCAVILWKDGGTHAWVPVFDIVWRTVIIAIYDNICFNHVDAHRKICASNS